ncbi:MAG: DUF255 domain-containing protein [Chloroflexi bacterium]|nr:DUF255 domain-containing protein [Chloroflexota bacterium]
MAGASGTNEQGNGIRWSHWNAEAIDRAQQQDKPVLLSITAVWCYWCHVMEETTYADGEVARFVNEHFVPLLVDNDHRPDVNARYNVGGWPTTAFLTPHGGYIAGATYLPPDQMMAMLIEVKRAYDEDRSGIYDQSAQLHRQRQEYVGQVAAGGEVGHRLVDIIARRMAGAYDARNGGFGEEPKFPSAPIIRLFLHLFRTTGEDFYGSILRKSLDSMLEGELYDRIDGGFFRFCALGDWTEAQHEKMLEDNVQLAGVFLDAGVLLEEPRYTRVASSTLDFLIETLLDKQAGGFRGSQGAHSDYFSMPEEARRISAPPIPDQFTYTNWNCQASSLMLEASWKLPRPELSSIAFELLDRLVDRAAAQHLPHVVDSEGNASEQTQPQSDLLCDWAAWFNALMDAHNCAPESPQYLQAAIEAAKLLDERFYDRARGAYFDIQADPEAVGYLRLREKPLPENVQVAEALLKLHHATGESSYQLRADNTLSAYAEANRDFGEHAASYALAVDHFLHPPVEITVEGPMGQAEAHSLAVAASRVSHPHVIVKPVNTEGEGALAHVCVETLCFPPVSLPEEIAESVEEALNGPQPTAGSIFQNFVSF